MNTKMPFYITNLNMTKLHSMLIPNIKNQGNQIKWYIPVLPAIMMIWKKSKVILI